MAVTSTEIITNHYHIVSLLRRVCASRVIVSLQRPHDQFIYNSGILDIDADRQSFTIDSPAESQIPLQARAGDWLKFRIKLQGLELRFEANIESILEDKTSSRQYLLQLPRQVNYQQRREAFRANIGYQFNASFTARAPEGQSLNGRLTDLSLGGASVEVDVACCRELKNNSPLTDCKLFLDNETISITSATIRAIQIAGESLEMYRLGIEFSDLSANERRQLQRWVMKFDRENCKSALSE